MEKQTSELLMKAIGLRCCDARVGFGRILRFGLGDKVYYTESRLKGKFHGEWDFMSSSSAWRLLKDKKLICGSYDYLEESEPLLGMLVGEQLISIVQPSLIDITFIFSNELQINLFGQSGNDVSLEVFAPGDLYLELKSEEWSESDSTESLEGLTTEEEKISNYSEQCHERWIQMVPARQTEDKCKDCAFFRKISGQFHFWDYGLCSNGLSAYDGKVVGCDSGCKYFNVSLPTVED